MKTEYVNLSVSDGTSMRAYVAHPDNQASAGMLVFQEVFGVNPHIRDVTERFARAGYLSIAPELFHRTAGDGFEASYTDFPAVMPHMQALKDSSLEADIRAAYEWLQKMRGGTALPVGSCGFCMGGRVSTLAAITVPLSVGVSFYGGGIAPSQFLPGLLDRLKNLQAPMLFFWGGKDGHIGPEQVQQVVKAMDEAGKPYANVVFSYADHGFFCDARASYNDTAAKQAWPMTLGCLEAYMGERSQSAKR